jgi:hypothetical protein
MPFPQGCVFFLQALAHVLIDVLCNFSCLAFSFLMAFALRTRLVWLNKRNKEHIAALSKEGKTACLELDDGEEIWDNDPRYAFTT